MGLKKATEIILSVKQEEILTKIKNGTHNASNLRVRAQIILMASQGSSNNAIERELGVGGEKVTQWRNRFAGAQAELSATESENPRRLRKELESVLSDAPRSGRKPTFTDEQVACIIALSCEKPETRGLPFSHWTPSMLREEAIRIGIVESISTMQISRFLKRKRSEAPSGQELAQPED